jgi:hypothetical protein
MAQIDLPRRLDREHIHVRELDYTLRGSEAGARNHLYRRLSWAAA